MADDIGWFNVSAYNHGMMGYRTPNIDRIAKEGAMFTDWYGEQSCTAGRAAFITGQSPIRTGLTKVGLPGADDRTACRGHERCRGTEAARLRHRTVRQEPPRRPERISADRARLRRVLRQPLSSQRRRGAGEPRLPEGSRASARSSVRAASSSARPATRTTRPSIRLMAGSASRSSRIQARSTPSAWRRWTRSSSVPRSISSTATARQARRGSATSTPPECTCGRI